MPQEPKKRHSRARQGKRRHAISLKVVDTKHKLTHFYAMLEKERAEKAATQTKQPKSTPAASANDEE
ncbi:MAG: hypothetical protein RLZZ455_386 [Candidatus Parcubacteria bacterium]|jgi:ribosomal protein L32